MSKNNKNIIINMIYTILNQFVNLFLPFMMIPYLARTLGVESLGVNSYSYALASFFSVISIFGIQSFGSREIAYANDDYISKKIILNNLLALKFITTFFSLALYYSYVLLFENELSIFLFVYSIFIIITFIDVTWFYVGEEKFKTVALRNILIKLLPAGAIFLIIDSQDDLLKFIIINLSVSFLANLYLVYDLKGYINIRFVKFNVLKKYFKVSFPFFFSSLIIQVYAQLDRVILGKMSNIYEVSLYDQGQKLILILLGFLSTISIVMSPRMANYYSNQNQEALKKYLNISLQASLLISIPSMFGIMLIGNQFSNLFYGEEFKGIESIVILHSPMLIFTSVGMIFGAQLLMQIGKMKQYNIGLLMGAFTSVILNFLLIPKLGAVGSTITKVITESLVTFFFIFIARKFVDVKKNLISLKIYFSSSLIFFVILNRIHFQSSMLVDVIIKIISAVIIYTLLIIVFKEPFVISVIRKKFKGEKDDINRN